MCLISKNNPTLCVASKGNGKKRDRQVEMGNTIGRRKRKAKIMKVDGEIFKLKTPARAGDVVKNYPGYVLLDSEAVKNFGLRAKPLEPQQELKPKKIYFLVQLSEPNPQEEKVHRRVRSSGLHMSAKDRLEVLLLSRRTVSDISIARPASGMVGGGPGSISGPITLKMRLPKSQLEKLVEDSHDQTEVAEKIMRMYAAIKAAGNSTPINGNSGVLVHRDAQSEAGVDVKGNGPKARQKRVSFFPVQGGEVQVDEGERLQ